MESRWSPVNSRWTPGELQVDSRRFSSNMTIFVESWWTPDGVHQIHLDYLESTWSMWSKVKYWDNVPMERNVGMKKVAVAVRRTALPAFRRKIRMYKVAIDLIVHGRSISTIGKGP